MQRAFMKSPAKINLGLNILKKRDDGFHDIESIMYQLGLTDTITFEKAAVLSLHSNEMSLTIEIENNLIIRAVRALEAKSGKTVTPEIELEKIIPMGAGLGGGSSNAAITLTALNELYELGIGEKDILEMASSLGSDVPFFTKHTPAYATSRGEVLERFNFILPYSVLLVNPGIHVATPWAYKNVIPAFPKHSLAGWVKSKSKNISELLPLLKNDFETPVFAAFPAIAAIKQTLLNNGAIFALMSGSGSSVFALFDDPMVAKAAENLYQQKYFTYLEFPDLPL